MNCEWVEKHLREYYDDLLDASTAAEMKAHVATCARCSAVLSDEYARFDQLIASLPRYEPPAELRARIFSSPEFRAIVHGPPPNDPPSTSPPPAPRPPTHAVRLVTQIVAVIVLLVGAGAIVANIAAQNRNPNGYASCPSTSEGQRIVYLDGTTLESSGAPLTCDAKISVGALWQVNPTGTLIAYVNQTTGQVRVIGADAANDHGIDTGAGVVVGLEWSPDGHSLAIVKQSNSRTISVWMATRDGEAVAHAQDFIAGGPVTLTAWSSDSQAFALAAEAVTGLGAIAIIYPQQNSGAMVTTDVVPQQIGWITGRTPRLVWMLTKGNATQFGSYWSGPETRPFTLTSVSAVALNPAKGQWAVATTNGIIALYDAVTGRATPFARLSAAPSRLIWSPDGTRLVVVGDSTLLVATPHGIQTLTTNLLPVPVAFSPDGSHIAYVAGNAVSVANLATGTIVDVLALGESPINALVWSPDGSVLAVWQHDSITLVGPTGSHIGSYPLSSPAQSAPQWSGR